MRLTSTIEVPDFFLLSEIMGMHYPAIFINISKTIFQNKVTPKTALKEIKENENGNLIYYLTFSSKWLLMSLGVDECVMFVSDHREIFIIQL